MISGVSRSAFLDPGARAIPADLMNCGLAYLVERTRGRPHRQYADRRERLAHGAEYLHKVIGVDSHGILARLDRFLALPEEEKRRMYARPSVI